MAESPGPATTGRSSVQQSTEQDANSSYPSPSHPLPLKRKKKEPGAPTWKKIVVLKSSDVRNINRRQSPYAIYNTNVNNEKVTNTTV